MNPEIDNIGAAIVKGVCNPEAEDFAIELGEFEIGTLLDEDVLKEIPIIKSVIACRKTWTAIHDHLFIRKVAGFLAACPRFTDAERGAFIQEYLNDAQKLKKLGDTIVLVLDKLDDLEKPEMVAKLFAAFVRKTITFDAFRRLTTGVDLSSMQDLKALAGETVIPESFAEPYPVGLVRSGFAKWVNKTSEYRGKTDQTAKVTELGMLFCKCVSAKDSQTN